MPVAEKTPVTLVVPVILVMPAIAKVDEGVNVMSPAVLTAKRIVSPCFKAYADVVANL